MELLLQPIVKARCLSIPRLPLPLRKVLLFHREIAKDSLTQRARGNVPGLCLGFDQRCATKLHLG